MKTDHTLTAERLRELVRYEDGELYWFNPHGRQVKNTAIGSRNQDGRKNVVVDGIRRPVHRLIWLYHHDAWPTGQIDHINGDPSDNRIENLRVVTNGENQQNVRRGGVIHEVRSWSMSKPWRARIRLNGKTIHLGYYATKEQAHAEYMRAKDVYHPIWVTGIGAMNDDAS